MFTGIVEAQAAVIASTSNRLTITRPTEFDELSFGQSIAINGACLSVAGFDEGNIFFDVLSQTFRKTNLAHVSYVNVERAMPADGRFEGHIVLGHVDETIELLEIIPEDSGVQYRFCLPSQKKYLVEKGSICLNGVSLTIGEITESYFSVYIIPITQNRTTFGRLQKGNMVNVEYDYVAKLMLQKNTLL